MYREIGAPLTLPGAAQPVDSALPSLLQALDAAGVAVLQAPPGAGKTTRVPLALLTAPWCRGRILMLQPRRLAARGAAVFMASQLGEPVGRTVGYQTRLERKMGPDTQVQVITEGILTRRLQQDPGLEGVDGVIFDEFHERSLISDLGLALCLQARELLRKDLRLLVMSATLDAEPVARIMGDAPVITSEGRSYPVDIRHLPPSRSSRPDMEPLMVNTLHRVLQEEQGSVLAFLPGQREIQRVAQGLEGRDLPAGVRILPLYGRLPVEAQQQAVAPALPGERKVVLTTDVAETSLTIEGVRVVVDSGLARKPRFNPASGMTRLETQRISRASATQRTGRAGRLEPGVSLRLWTQSEEQAMPTQRVPEILEADLAPLALELACWGADPQELAWLDAPPIGALSQARSLLQALGALDEAYRPTEQGRRMATLGVHPRLAHLLLSGQRLGLTTVACQLAALLEEPDLLMGLDGPAQVDIHLRLEALEGHEIPGHRVNKGVRHRVREQSRRLAARLASAKILPLSGPEPLEPVGLLLAMAYPDRIGLRRDGAQSRYRLSGGRGAALPGRESLGGQEWIVVPSLDAGEREARVFLAARLAREDLEQHMAERFTLSEQITWDARAGAVSAQRARMLGSLPMSVAAVDHPDPEAIRAALLQGIRQAGLNSLPWTPQAESLCERVSFLHRNLGDPWPDLSRETLLQALDHWLGPWVTGMTRLSHLTRLDLHAILMSRLEWPLPRDLEHLAPTHWPLPGGARVRLDYSQGEVPVLAARLQLLFGLTETPCLAQGQVPVMVHVLSPAQRPVQITQDLAGFWERTYPEVKKDLKGRYPKHAWPEDPLTAPPRRR
ncbi:ATP-dependent helicase HrpB [Ectothiorhodospira marina]|uniref:ATP-dependent helicase HrpB n=1 Tax=Ectothiorhodospira marina TaxID=1396821 RepID=A0A1H7IXT9_9GAMM|nr:ATP-dependent helicase HrpB [Ectothiorhodospira marina]SEK67218.1 ATP-dependent helicase HrpB [Ectothiorhodospira marina]